MIRETTYANKGTKANREKKKMKNKTKERFTIGSITEMAVYADLFQESVVYFSLTAACSFRF